MLVPAFLRPVDPAREAVLALARQVGGYGEAEVPDEVRLVLDSCDVPAFRLP